MSIEIKNNQLIVANLAWTPKESYIVDDFEILVSNATTLEKEEIINDLSILHDSINFPLDVFEVAAIISNDNEKNKNKLSLQKQMLNNRYDIFSNYEDNLKLDIDSSFIVDKIESVSTEYLSLYENINNINLNIDLQKNNFGGEVFKYFRGEKTYKIGKIIYWANKFLNIDYDNISFDKYQKETNFLEDLKDKSYDFKSYISLESNQDIFIVNDLLLDQTNFSRNSVNKSYVNSTIEIVAQSLVNISRAMYLPVHTIGLTDRSLQQSAFKLHNLLNKTKSISKISKYPTIKFRHIPDTISESESNKFRINVFSNNINTQKSSISSKTKLIDNKTIKENILRSSIRYSSNSFTDVNEDEKYFNNIKNPNERGQLSIRFGRQKPLPMTAASFIQNNVNFLQQSDPVRITIGKLNSINNPIFSKFENSGNDNDINTLQEFYDINSTNTFKFSELLNDIDLSYLTIKLSNLLNNVKLKIIEKKEIDVSFAKNSLKNLSLDNDNFVFGNSSIGGLLNINNFEENIFYNNDFFYNDFSNSLIVSDKIILNTINSLGDKNEINLEPVSNFKENFEKLLINYYPDNILKNHYEFFKKIYSDFSGKTLYTHIENSFSYNRDMLYSKTLLNKKSINNVANIFLAKSLSLLLDIKLEESIFEDSSFNIDINYKGKSSDFLNEGESFIVLNDIHEITDNTISVVDEFRSSNTPKIIYSMYIGQQGVFFTQTSNPNDNIIIEREFLEAFREEDRYEELILSIASKAATDIGDEFRDNFTRTFDYYSSIIKYGLEEPVADTLQAEFNSREEDNNSRSDEAISRYIEVIQDSFATEINRFRQARASGQLTRPTYTYDGLPSTYNRINLIPFEFDARIGGLIFSEYNEDDNDYINLKATLDENNDQSLIKNNNVRKKQTYELNAPPDNSPLSQIYKNEKRYRKEVFLSERSSIFDVVFDTLNCILKSIFSDDELNSINSQEDIISFVKNNTFVTNQIKELIDVYKILFNNTYDKVFNVAVIDYITQGTTLRARQSGFFKEFINKFFYLLKFKEFFLKELDKNKKIADVIFQKQDDFNEIIEDSGLKTFIEQHTDSTSFDFIYTINDYYLVKLLNILRRSEITRSANFEVVYSYLEDTLNVNKKIEKIREGLEGQIENLENIASKTIDSENIINLSLLENKNPQFLKNYYNYSIKHAQIKNKIIEEKEKNNLNYNFVEDILKNYNEKKYSYLQNKLSNSKKDIICIAIFNEKIKNTNLNTVYKISVSLADHARPDLFVYEKDFFYSPSYSSNSKIVKDLTIDTEINFGDSNLSEGIMFMNSDALFVKDRINLITLDQLKEINKARMKSSTSLSEDNIDLLSEKMFYDYRNSGLIEETLKLASNFPDKDKIFTSFEYNNDIVENNTIRLVTNLSSNKFLSLFNETKENFLLNVEEVTADLSTILYDYEEMKLNTKLYSFIKNYNQVYEKIDIREVLENKIYYDFFFIEVSPEDFIYKSPFTDLQIRQNYQDDENNTSIFKFVTLNPTDPVNYDYLIKDIDEGIKRKYDDNRKNNYNYVIKIEEVK